MGGIVGILNLDGTPVNRRLLQSMTEFMRYRGPDALEIWTAGPVGFGHAMLRTTHESSHEQQPASLDGQVWITADARLDDRRELICKIESKGRRGLNSITDAQLILHAYHVWGEECVNQFLGDFAFAIWDERLRRLFCARDHFGVKLFFYAQVGEYLVFSNTLNCVRLHPTVSDKLNDLAVGDFLLFGLNHDPATTTFADIQRLPPAHTLSWDQGRPRVGRYWSLPIEDPVRYKRSTDYVEHFRDLLRSAVADRLRINCIGIFMSGGLDSTTVAATAKEVLSQQSSSFDLRAHTVVYDRLIRDRERHYSGLVADALGIPIHYLVADGYGLYDRWWQPEGRRPEPSEYPLQALEVDRFRNAAMCSRVVLTGDGGDPGLCMSLSSHLLRLFRGLRLGRLVTDLGRYMMVEGRVSRLYVRRRLGIVLGRIRSRRLYPTWLNPDFEARLHLPARWEQINCEAVPNHPLRPEAYRVLVAQGPYWQWGFEGYDASATFSPVEARHPFFDLRVVRYLLRVPPLPWCADKELLRIAMRGVLPEPVRLRRKVPLAGDPVVKLLQSRDAQWVDQFEPAPTLGQYVDRRRVPRVRHQKNLYHSWVSLRPISLNLWLQSLNLIKYKTSSGDEYEVTRCSPAQETL